MQAVNAALGITPLLVQVMAHATARLGHMSLPVDRYFRILDSIRHRRHAYEQQSEIRVWNG